jgi:hypothetical protein
MTPEHVRIEASIARQLEEFRRQMRTPPGPPCRWRCRRCDLVYEEEPLVCEFCCGMSFEAREVEQ